MPIMAQSAAASGGGSISSLLILALPLLLIGYMLYNQRRRQKATASMQSELQPGDQVMTTAGLFGTLRWLDGTKVHLEVAPGVVVEWDRRAILRAPVTPAAGPGDADESALSDDEVLEPGAVTDGPDGTTPDGTSRPDGR